MLKEPPVVAKGDIPMKKIKESLKKYNTYYGLEEAESIIDEMCGKKHIEEVENDIDNVPEKEPAEQLNKVTKDIAEVKQLVGEALVEYLLSEGDYQAYFKSMLAKWGVKSPAELPPDKRKKFFAAVSAGWKKEKGE